MSSLEVEMVKKLLIVGAGLASAAAAAGYVAARGQWRQWGIDPDEVRRALPGDELVPDAEAVDTRGIDIAAPPAVVWPWLVQMGYGRAGWYSYDQLDMNHPSADRILPEFQSLAVGDLLPTDPGGGFEVKIAEPDRALVVYIDRALVETQRGPAAKGGVEGAPAEGTTTEAAEAAQADAAAPEAPKGEIADASMNVRATGAYLDRAVSGDFAASWAFVLEPRDEGTRLIERFRARMEPPTTASGRAMPLARTMLGFGVFVMVRRQLLGIRDRVEGRPVRARAMKAPRLARPAAGASAD
jgi:hypothetical protein